MAWTRVQTRSATDGTGNPISSLTVSISPTAGNILTIGFIFASGSFTSLQDNLSHTISTDENFTVPTTGTTLIVFHVLNIPSGVTGYTLTMSATFPTIVAVEYSWTGGNTRAATLDKLATGTATGLASASTSSATTTANNELIIGWAANSQGGTTSAGSGFTLNPSTTGEPFEEDQTLAAAGSISAGFNATIANNWAIAMQTFAPPSVASGVSGLAGQVSGQVRQSGNMGSNVL